MTAIKKKHLDRREWYSDSDRDFACLYHADHEFHGGIGLITFTGLKKPDVVILAEIYAARERNTIGISSADLAEHVPGAVFCETLPEVTQFLKENVREGDIVITMGAGDIFRAGEALLSE